MTDISNEMRDALLARIEPMRPVSVDGEVVVSMPKQQGRGTLAEAMRNVSEQMRTLGMTGQQVAQRMAEIGAAVRAEQEPEPTERKSRIERVAEELGYGD